MCFYQRQKKGLNTVLQFFSFTHSANSANLVLSALSVTLFAESSKYTFFPPNISWAFTRSKKDGVTCFSVSKKCMMASTPHAPSCPCARLADPAWASHDPEISPIPNHIYAFAIQLSNVFFEFTRIDMNAFVHWKQQFIQLWSYQHHLCTAFIYLAGWRSQFCFIHISCSMINSDQIRFHCLMNLLHWINWTEII